jgi:hypothetical protein
MTAVDIVGSGFRLSTSNEVVGRLSVCGDCERSKVTKAKTVCTLCNCNMDIKARFAASKCPLDKWDKPQE